MKRKRGPVLYCGDPHGGVGGSLQYIVDAALEVDASAVILLGDMEPRRPLHEEMSSIADRVWWIGGNHDSNNEENWRRVYESDLAERCLDGRVVVLPDGTRIGGLGGVFRDAVWHPKLDVKYWNRASHGLATPQRRRWKDGPPLRHVGSIYPDELVALSSLQADVLVTHEAPGYHPCGFEILDDLARSLGVKVSVHGHHHDCRDSRGRHSRQGFCSFGVGLRGVSAICVSGQATIVRRGELDSLPFCRNLQRRRLPGN